MSRRSFGSIRQLPAKHGKGRFQARYVGPDGRNYTARTPDDRPLTFTTKTAASKWLAKVDAQIQAGTWEPLGTARPADKPLTLGEYAEQWLDGKNGQLRPSTRQSYRGVLDNLILPSIGDVPLADVSQETVERWWSQMPLDRPTYAAHGYQVLRAILRSARKRRLISDVPSIDGAGRTKRSRELRLLEPAELDRLAAELPARYRLLPLLAARCALRYGEVTALRTRDVDLRRGVVKVARGVTRTRGEWHVSTPKNGRPRTVPLAPSLVPKVRDHVNDLAPDDLLFPAPRRDGFMHAPEFNRMFRRAAEAIGRPDIHVHDLRHFGATWFAMTGATLAEIMQFAGHTTASAALLYQHAATDRAADLAAKMDTLINAAVDLEGTALTR